MSCDAVAPPFDLRFSLFQVCERVGEILAQIFVVLRTDTDPRDPRGIGHDPRLDLAHVHTIGLWLGAALDPFDRRDLVHDYVRLFDGTEPAAARETN